MEKDDLLAKLKELANKPVKSDEFAGPEVKEPVKPGVTELKKEPKPSLAYRVNVSEVKVPGRKGEICARLGEILAEHDGLESNVPALKSHEYWQLKAELNQL